MKKAIFLLLIAVAVSLAAQEKSVLTVKTTDVVSGVVIVIGQSSTVATGSALTEPAKRTVELQCNKGVSSCTSLKPGTYTMLRLPPNRGMYECANVQVFALDADPDKADRIGEYCLTLK